MSIPRIPEGEYRFCLIMWEHEPVSTLELVKLCQEKLAWKRTTTYTVLKRLSERGLFANEGGIVRSLVGREEFYSKKSESIVNESFGGSLPAFIASFTRGRNLSEKEISEIEAMIEQIKRR